MTVWALLVLPLVAVGMAMALFLSLGNSDRAEALGTPSPDIIIAIDQGNNGSTDCDTDPGTAGIGAKCTFSTGDSFTLDTRLQTLTGLPDNDMDTKTGYNSFDESVLYSVPTLVRNDRPLTGEVVGPTCGIAAENTANEDGLPPDDEIEHSCVLGVGANEQTFLGTVFENDFTCDEQGVASITLRHGGPTDSHVTDDAGNISNDQNQKGADEVLTVNCAPPAATIGVNVSETNVAGKKIAGTCVLVSVDTMLGSPPAPVNLPIDAVSDNNAKAICDGALGGPLSDSNPAVGNYSISISGGLRLQYGDVWHVQQVQGGTKHDLDNTKYDCDITTGSCQVNITNTRLSGNGTVLFNDLVTGQPLPGQCVVINPGAIAECDGDNDGDINFTLALGVYTVDYDPVNQPGDRQVKTPTSVACDLSGTSTATQTCTVKFNFNPTVPFNLKLPVEANLFLTSQAVKSGSGKLAPQTCEAGTDVARFDHVLSNKPTSPDPKDTTPPIDLQEIGAFELEVRFDNKLVCVNLVEGAYWAANPDSACFIDDKDDGIRPQNLARIGCVMKTKNPVDPQVVTDLCSGKGTALASVMMACIEVRPQPELYTQIIANQDNHTDLMILNQDCNLADLQGHPIQKIGCDDSSLSIRWLEGDVNGDCRVDIADQQILASRWGAQTGSGLYNARFDLEPSGIPGGGIEGDGDIDIKDVQFVYGRHGSICENQNQEGLTGPAHPPQPPSNPLD
jgi:hypothetical protein